MTDKPEDLKSLLLEVLLTVRSIKDDHEKRFDELDRRLAKVIAEHQEIKELLGEIGLREMGRLGGRIDQLAQDVAFGHRGAA